MTTAAELERAHREAPDDDAVAERLAAALERDGRSVPQSVAAAAHRVRLARGLALWPVVRSRRGRAAHLLVDVAGRDRPRAACGRDEWHGRLEATTARAEWARATWWTGTPDPRRAVSCLSCRGSVLADRVGADPDRLDVAATLGLGPRRPHSWWITEFNRLARAGRVAAGTLDLRELRRAVAASRLVSLRRSGAALPSPPPRPWPHDDDCACDDCRCHACGNVAEPATRYCAPCAVDLGP